MSAATAITTEIARPAQVPEGVLSITLTAVTVVRGDEEVVELAGSTLYDVYTAAGCVTGASMATN